MKTILSFLGLALLMSFGSPAAACGTSATDTSGCPIFTAQGDTVTSGTVQLALTHWVMVCYPPADWSSQQERTGQAPFYVSRAVAGNTDEPAGRACGADQRDRTRAGQYYQPKDQRPVDRIF